MTPDSLQQARRLLLTPGLRSFSLDVFDTLLLRRCTGPDGVYERTLHELDIPERCKGLADSFVQNRAIAEMKARRAAKGREVTTEEIYARFPRQVFGAGHLGPHDLAAAEFRAEQALCVLNPQIVALAHEARAAGLAVGFISDTYWSEAQVLRLMGDGLHPDFLYVSSAYGFGKAAGLLQRYLDERQLSPCQALHMGDNMMADVSAALGLGMAAVHYPQQPPALSAAFRGEDSMARLLKIQHPGLSCRLDGGFRLVRRMAAADAVADNAADLTGATVLGPIMTAFHAFVRRRVEEIRRPGRDVKVLFLARDGFLPFRFWQEASAGEASYVEINRRVALVAAAGRSVEPLQELFQMIQLVDRDGVAAFLKSEVPSVGDYFAQLEDGLSTGTGFAEALPELLNADTIGDISRSTRERLLEHLRHAVAGFDAATDLVLVDLGYSGTIQRTLRMVFDQDGIAKRLHGVYLASLDDVFADLPAEDSYAGFLDDTVLPPVFKRLVLRNATIIEQSCSAPVGSVRDYHRGVPVRERDPRPDHQIERCGDLKEASLAFFRRWRQAAAETGVDPFADLDRARLWAVAILMRLLTLPGTAEIRLFGSMYQDPNLGSESLMPMVHAPMMEAALDAMPFVLAACMREPPTWPSGTLTALSRTAGFSYSMMANGLMPPDVLADEPAGQVSVAVIRDGIARPLDVDLCWTGGGDIRLRIPLPASHLGCRVAVPLQGVLACGVVRAVSLQRGASVSRAVHDRFVVQVPPARLDGIGAAMAGRWFQAEAPGARLVVPVDEDVRSALAPEPGDVVVLTLRITPLPAEEMVTGCRRSA